MGKWLKALCSFFVFLCALHDSQKEETTQKMEKKRKKNAILFPLSARSSQRE
jgi:hypothetical protein